MKYTPISSSIKPPDPTRPDPTQFDPIRPLYSIKLDVTKCDQIKEEIEFGDAMSNEVE